MGWEKRECAVREVQPVVLLSEIRVFTPACLTASESGPEAKPSIKASVIQPHFKARAHMWRHTHVHTQRKSRTGTYKHEIDVTKGFYLKGLTSFWHVFSCTVESFVFFSPFCSARHSLFIETTNEHLSLPKNTSAASWNVWNAVISKLWLWSFQFIYKQYPFWGKPFKSKHPNSTSWTQSPRGDWCVLSESSGIVWTQGAEGFVSLTKADRRRMNFNTPRLLSLLWASRETLKQIRSLRSGKYTHSCVMTCRHMGKERNGAHILFQC